MTEPRHCLIDKSLGTTTSDAGKNAGTISTVFEELHWEWRRQPAGHWRAAGLPNHRWSWLLYANNHLSCKPPHVKVSAALGSRLIDSSSCRSKRTVAPKRRSWSWAMRYCWWMVVTRVTWRLTRRIDTWRRCLEAMWCFKWQSKHRWALSTRSSLIALFLFFFPLGKGSPATRTTAATRRRCRRLKK